MVFDTLSDASLHGGELLRCILGVDAPQRLDCVVLIGGELKQNRSA